MCMRLISILNLNQITVKMYFFKMKNDTIWRRPIPIDINHHSNKFSCNYTLASSSLFRHEQMAIVHPSSSSTDLKTLMLQRLWQLVQTRAVFSRILRFEKKLSEQEPIGSGFYPIISVEAMISHRFNHDDFLHKWTCILWTFYEANTSEYLFSNVSSPGTKSPISIIADIPIAQEFISVGFKLHATLMLWPYPQNFTSF